MRMPISRLGLQQAWYNEQFLKEIVEATTVEVDPPFSTDDAWWWLCMVMEAMKGYGRRDLRRTALKWAIRISPIEVYRARDAAERGDFNQFLPKDVM